MLLVGSLVLPDTGSYAGEHCFPLPDAPVDYQASGVEAARQEADTSSPVEPVGLRAFVYVPDTIPEILSASAFLPCSVDAAIGALVAARQAADILRFPRFVPVTPQPFAECVLAVALPKLGQIGSVVLLDCRRINQAIFAKVLHPRLNRESLLLAAGQPHDSTWDMCVCVCVCMAYCARSSLVS